MSAGNKQTNIQVKLSDYDAEVHSEGFHSFVILQFLPV